MRKEAEKRYSDSALELREEKSEDGSIGTVSGYAAVFNELSEELGVFFKFREKIAPGAFANSISGDVRAFWSHNPDFVLGRTKNETLSLNEDGKGLRFSLKLPDTQAGRDALTLIRNRTVTGMSFGFFIEEDAWKRGSKTEAPIRTLLKVNLFEVSPVAFPAYPQTEVQARSVFIPEAIEMEAKAAYEEDVRSRLSLAQAKAALGALKRILPTQQP